MFDPNINGEDFYDSWQYYEDHGYGEDGFYYKPRGNSKKLIEFECEIKRETEKAFLIEVSDMKPFWIPKSKCEKTIKGVTIPKWLCEKKGL